MSLVWHSDDVPAPVGITPAGWARVVARGAALGGLTFGSFALLLLVRLVERPLFGQGRPLTPFISQFVCRSAFVILGMRRYVHGVPIQSGAVVSNHASWLDIFTLNAGQRIYFVSKSDVRSWPGIGWLARATGTVFIKRDPREARRQADQLRARLALGHALLFFPEGTSTDGRRVLAFRSTLFAAFFDEQSRGGGELQPVTVVYRAPPGTDPRFYGWWGNMGFGAHLTKLLAAPRHGAVDVTYHPPIRISDHPDRKAIARHCESVVRAELLDRIGVADGQAAR